MPVMAGMLKISDCLSCVNAIHVVWLINAEFLIDMPVSSFSWFRPRRLGFLAGWFLASALPGQTLTGDPPQITEADAASVNAGFNYQFPATDGGGSFEFAVIPGSLRPGVDFTPFRETRTAAVGGGLTGSVRIPVLPDLRVERDGQLSLVVRKPDAADWADSLSSAVTLPDFTSASGPGHTNFGAKILYWSDTMIVAARRSSEVASGLVETYERGAGDQFSLKSSLTIAPDLFPSVQVNDRAMVASNATSVKTWRRAAGEFTWQPAGTFSGDSSRAPFLALDRLVMRSPTAGMNLVYRLDPSAESGWRLTGMMPFGSVLTAAGDSVVLDTGYGMSVWQRADGAEDQWVPAKGAGANFMLTGPQRVAQSPGLLAFVGAQGVELHEELEGGIWEKIPGPEVLGPDSVTKLLIAGDWLGVVQTTQPSGAGVLRFFLRNTSDRTKWDSAGALPLALADYPSHFFWQGLELVVSTSQSFQENTVTLRKFEGATVLVRDDDRRKVSVTTFTSREPSQGSAQASCFGELPLPAEEPVTLDYRLLPGTAVAGEDYEKMSGQVTIPAGSARVAVPLKLLADGKPEGPEFLNVELSSGGAVVATGRLDISDSAVAAVVSASATPLLEGYGQSTVTVRGIPALGQTLPETPLPLDFSGGGLMEQQETISLAVKEKDLPTFSFSGTLSPNTPVAGFTLTASQDTVEEPEDERIRASFADVSSPWAAGSMGWRHVGPAPATPAGLEVTPESLALRPWCVMGEWFFGAWSGYGLQNSGSKGMVGCYRFAGASGIGAQPVQLFPWEGGDLTPQALVAEGGTLVLTFLIPSSSGLRIVLRMYEMKGPAEAPWLLSGEWSQQSYNPTYMETRFLNPDLLQWGMLLFERAGGAWNWRVAGFMPEQVLAADGDWLCTRPTFPQGTILLSRRAQGGQPAWNVSATFDHSIDGQAGFGTAALRGSTLVLGDSRGRGEIRRLGTDGKWVLEQAVPRSTPHAANLLLTSEATLIAGDRIYSRTGTPAVPWQQTGMVPEYPANLDDLKVGDAGRLLVWTDDDSGSEARRIRILSAGLDARVVDDDSLKFQILREDGAIPFEWERTSGETVARLWVRATRPPPFPVTMHVHSADNGSAVAGEDYLPVDLRLTLPSILPDGTFSDIAAFPVRILSDRLPEGSETLKLLMDPVPFGYADASTAMTIVDYETGVVQPPAAAVLLAEPASGQATESVEFRFLTAFDMDLSFVVSTTPAAGATGAVSGQDFLPPPEAVVLKAGENCLRVPITLLADTLDEPMEKLTLSIRTAEGRYSTSAPLSILDSTVPGLMADSYAGIQDIPLTADGSNGNPPGLGANDPAHPAGSYILNRPPGWGTVSVKADGGFAASPGPNVVGAVRFENKVETIPFQQFLNSSSAWRYLHPLDGVNPATANPAFPATWATESFDDSSWATASGVINYGGFPVQIQPVKLLTAPPSGKRYTDYFRATFQCATDLNAPLTLKLHCDDGAVIYVNGIERGRAISNTSTTFAAAADTYTMLTGGSQSEAQEIALQTVNLGTVPLHAGANVLAISLHNIETSSSDLGLALVTLETALVTDPVPVTITFEDARRVPSGKPDSRTVPENAEFLSSDNYGPSLLENDGLIDPSGEYYDPVLEVTNSAASAGTLTLVGNTGHFRYTPPADFTGVVSFTYQIRDKDGWSDPIPVMLTVQPALPFDLWKVEALSANASGEADADGDGWSNFLEYALGTDPEASFTGSGYGFIAEPEGRLSLLVRQAKDLAWRLESAESPDSAQWQMVREGRGLNYLSPEAPGITITPVSATAFRIGIAPSPESQPRLFYRLRTSRIPPQG